MLKLDNRIFYYSLYQDRINPWIKDFLLNMINVTMYERPNNEAFDYQSLLQKDLSYSTETLNVKNIDYFIRYLIHKKFIPKNIFSSSIHDEYLSTLTKISQKELSEARQKLSEAEEEKNKQEIKKKAAKGSLDQAQKEKDDILKHWYDPARKDANLNRAKKTFEHEEENFLLAEKKWKNKKIELEKLTIQFQLMHNSNMHHFFSGLNKNIANETLAIPMKEIVSIDPLLSEKLFNPETYTNEENKWVKEYIENIVKKTLMQHPFGFTSDYNALLANIFNGKEKDLNVNSTDFILNIVRIKLKLPIENLIQGSDLKSLSSLDEINRKLQDIENKHVGNIKFLEKKNFSNKQEMNEAQNYIDSYNDFFGVPTRKEKMEKQLKKAKENEKQYQEEEILIRNNYLKEKAIPVAQKKWLELSNDDPILKEFLGEISNKITATNLINNYPSYDGLKDKITQGSDFLENHWLVSGLAPHYSGIDSLNYEYSYQLFYGNLGLSWVKNSVMQKKQLIVDILAEEGGVALLQDFFKETGIVKRLLVQNLQDLVTFFSSLPENEQTNGLPFLEFMQCPVEAILHEAFASDINALPQFVKIINRLSIGNRTLFIEKYKTEIFAFLKKVLVRIISDFRIEEKENYKHSDYFVEDKQVIKILFDACSTVADFSFQQEITIEQLFALYEIGFKDFSYIKFRGDFPEYLKDERLKNIKLSPVNFFYFLEKGYTQFTASNAINIIETLQSEYDTGKVANLMEQSPILPKQKIIREEIVSVMNWHRWFNLQVAEQALDQRVYGLSMNYKEVMEELSGYSISASEAKTYLLYAAQTELDLTFPFTIKEAALGDKKNFFLAGDNPLKYIKNEYLEAVRKGVTLTQQANFLQEQKLFENVSLLDFPQQQVFLDKLGVDENFSQDDDDYSITLAERLNSLSGKLFSIKNLNYRIFDQDFGLSWFELNKSSNDLASQITQPRTRFVDAIRSREGVLFLITSFSKEHWSQLIQTVDDLNLFF